MPGKINLSLSVFRAQIAHRDANSGKRHQEVNSPFATQPGGLSRCQPTQLVELRGEQKFGFFRKLLGGQTKAKQKVIAVPNRQRSIHRQAPDRKLGEPFMPNRKSTTGFSKNQPPVGPNVISGLTVILKYGTIAGVKTSLFITCLVDQLFPNVGIGMVEVLERLGVEVEFNPEQTCCGQPFFNTGYRREAAEVARRFLRVFGESEYIVAPSGSCTAMVKVFYQELFHHDEKLASESRQLAARLYEFSEFLVNVLKVEDVGASYRGKVTYHDSCHLLRELRISREPRRLIRAVKGIEFIEMTDSDSCCGFGGTFSVKHPEISCAILSDKLNNLAACGADTVVASDSSCLMQIAGGLGRQRIPARTMHLAELLAMRE
jgi:L-lactate dehydrogenase complex protein LldE